MSGMNLARRALTAFLGESHDPVETDAQELTHQDFRIKLARELRVSIEVINKLTADDVERIMQLVGEYPLQMRFPYFHVNAHRTQEMGFIAGEPVFHFGPHFTKRQFFDALTAPYHKPMSLWIEPLEGLRLQIAIESAKKVKDDLGRWDRNDEVIDYPSWYAEGTILHSTNESLCNGGLLRMYLSVDTGGSLSSIYFQRIPTRPNSDAPVCTISCPHDRRSDLN